MLLAAGEHRGREPPCDLYVACEDGAGVRRLRAGRRGARAPGSRAAGAGRPLASRASSSRPTGRAPATLRSSARRDDTPEGHGDRRAGGAADAVGRGRPRAEGTGSAVRRAPRANGFRDAWAGDRCGADARGDEVRVAGWVHRRRDHGGLIFIDLRDRSGHRAARLPPGDARRRASRSPSALRSEHVVTAARHGRARARTGNVNPNMPTGEIEIAGRPSCERLAESRDAAVPDRRGRRGRRDRCACSTARSTCAAT